MLLWACSSATAGGDMEKLLFKAPRYVTVERKEGSKREKKYNFNFHCKKNNRQICICFSHEAGPLVCDLTIHPDLGAESTHTYMCFKDAATKRKCKKAHWEPRWYPAHALSCLRQKKCAVSGSAQESGRDCCLQSCFSPAKDTLNYLVWYHVIVY